MKNLSKHKKSKIRFYQIKNLNKSSFKLPYE